MLLLLPLCMHIGCQPMQRSGWDRLVGCYKTKGPEALPSCQAPQCSCYLAPARGSQWRPRSCLPPSAPGQSEPRPAAAGKLPRGRRQLSTPSHSCVACPVCAYLSHPGSCGEAAAQLPLAQRAIPQLRGPPRLRVLVPPRDGRAGLVDRADQVPHLRTHRSWPGGWHHQRCPATQRCRHAGQCKDVVPAVCLPAPALITQSKRSVAAILTAPWAWLA